MTEKDYSSEFMALLRPLNPETKEMLRVYLKALHNESQVEKQKNRRLKYDIKTSAQFVFAGKSRFNH